MGGAECRISCDTFSTCRRLGASKELTRIVLLGARHLDGLRGGRERRTEWKRPRTTNRWLSAR